MTSWGDLEATEPDFARRVQERFDRYMHKTIATLRKDGGPRISGVEARFSDGDLWFGMMPRSLKARDLLRDPRFALHSGTEDPPADPSAAAGVAFDAKIRGRAVAVTDADALRRYTGSEEVPDFHLFRADLEEVVLIGLGDPPDHLLIETWHPRSGIRTTKRH